MAKKILNNKFDGSLKKYNSYFIVDNNIIVIQIKFTKIKTILRFSHLITMPNIATQLCKTI